jgi:hypothetical protein
MYIYTLTYTTLKPNPTIHLNIMCIWIGELVTKLPLIGFKVHLCTSTFLLITNHLSSLDYRTLILFNILI